MSIEKCFFCDKIIIPLRYVSIDDVVIFFKDNKLDFTLNHERSRKRIGNKVICLGCEQSLKSIVREENDECQECKECKNENNVEEERFGE